MGGGSRVRDIWKHYLAESFCFIYVIDASNRNRINECKTVFSTFLENEKVAGKPILMYFWFNSFLMISFYKWSDLYFIIFSIDLPIKKTKQTH